MRKASALIALLCAITMTMFSGCSSLRAPSTRQVMYSQDAVHSDFM